MQLFRQQALDHHNRLHGDIFLATPLRWQAIGLLLFSAVAIAALFLIFGSYSRTMTASGLLHPAGGVTSIAVPDDGVLVAVLARDGQQVRQGQVVARLALPQSVDGRSLAEARKAALGEQAAALNRQRQSVGSAIGERRQQLATSIADEQRQIAAIDSQIGSQRALIGSSEEELGRIADVAARGFISGHDMQLRREQLISRKQGLAQLLQSQSQHQRDLAAARIELAQLSAHLQAGVSDYDAQLAQLRREDATLGNAGVIDLVAGRTGVLTALRARLGDSVAKGAVYGRIVPATGQWEAQLRVPSSAITQIGPGQAVRVTLAAYPVQDYGIVHGVIDRVGSAPVEAANPYFLVVARLDPLTERQRARGVLLRPDLALSARIVLDRRSFLQWLIDPIGAVAAR